MRSSSMRSSGRTSRWVEAMIVAAMFACWMAGHPPGMTPQLVAYVYQQADQDHVPRSIAVSIIWQESGWDVMARHENGNSVDMGLWEINSFTLTGLEKTYNKGIIGWPYDPYMQTRLALHYLAALYLVTQSWRMAVAAYNAGLRSAIMDQLPVSTDWYVKAVIGRADM